MAKSIANSDFSAEVLSGLKQLLQAYDYARELRCPLWDFSVELDRLVAVGMTTSDLRSLVMRGLLGHAREITTLRDDGRCFAPPSTNLAFARGTCFVLTPAGLTLLGREVSDKDRASNAQERHSPAGRTSVALTTLRSSVLQIGSLQTSKRRGAVPNWDRDARVFLVGEHLVKRFRVPSPNQEAVLDAFQEEGWPRVVDDPLPPVPDQQPKRRLRDTIKCLNLNQATRAIRFRGDGTGQRVFWELLPLPSESRQPARRAA